MILEQQRIPASVLCLEDTALRYAGSIHLPVKLQAGVKDFFALPAVRVQSFGAPADLLSASACGPLDHEQIVVLPDLVSVEPLADIAYGAVYLISVIIQRRILNQRKLFPESNVPIGLLRQLSAEDRAAAVEQIQAVVRGQQRRIVQIPAEL